MKTVFTSQEIAHVWAHQSAPHGKSPGNASFNGNAFLSYSTVMARHIEHKGKRAIIFNATSYSNSTAKVQNRICAAIHGHDVPIFRVTGQPYNVDLRFTGDELFKWYIERAALSEASAKTPRRIQQKTRDSFKSQASSYLEQAREVASFYGLRKKVDEKAIERLATAKAREEKRERIAREKREAEAMASQQNAYRAWVNSERPTGPTEFYQLDYFNPSLFPTAFRIEGEELVSSKGARVPLQAARIALRFVMRHRATGWHRNGETHQVGMYHLDSVNPQGVVAGCHRITWEELERVEVMLSTAPVAAAV
jgi:hypothetical protein